jgi:ketosteroid isomerase-like protein
MSARNVEIVRGLFEAFESGDALGLVESLSPELVFHVREDEPDAAVHEGLEAVTASLINWLEAFPDLTFEEPGFSDEGDWVIATFLLCGRGGASGASVIEPYAWALRLENEKVVEVREFHTADEARAAIARLREASG